MPTFTLAPADVIVSRDPLTLAVNLGRCTCGSGWNPRHCSMHPLRFQEHIDEMNRENEAAIAKDDEALR